MANFSQIRWIRAANLRMNFGAMEGELGAPWRSYSFAVHEVEHEVERVLSRQDTPNTVWGTKDES